MSTPSMFGWFGPVKYGTVNEPSTPIAVNVVAMMIGTPAIGTTTLTTTRQKEAPASRAASIIACGTACIPDVTSRVANGSDVNPEPMTTVTSVYDHTGKPSPNWAATL